MLWLQFQNLKGVLARDNLTLGSFYILDLLPLILGDTAWLIMLPLPLVCHSSNLPLLTSHNTLPKPFYLLIQNHSFTDGGAVKIYFLGQQGGFPAAGAVPALEGGDGEPGVGYPRLDFLASTRELSTVHGLRIPWIGRGTQGSPHPAPGLAQHHPMNPKMSLRELSKHLLKAELETTQHNIPVATPGIPSLAEIPPRARLGAAQAVLSFQPSVRNSRGVALPSINCIFKSFL